jgi:hypothetical protein
MSFIQKDKPVGSNHHIGSVDVAYGAEHIVAFQLGDDIVWYVEVVAVEILI